jgi:20S proteasome alpha/beta subunit
VTLLPWPNFCIIILTHTQIREYLEKSYVETSGRDTVKLTIRALMETVEASSKNIEIAVMEPAGLRCDRGACSQRAMGRSC